MTSGQFPHTRSTYAGLWLIVLAVTSMTGCNFQKAPEVSLSSMAPTQSSHEAVRVEFVLSVHNPNQQPIELRELVYHLAVDGRRVYSGRRASQTTLPALGHSNIIVPAIVPADMMQDSQRNYAMSGSLIYVAQDQISELLLDIGLPRPRVGFGSSGSLVHTGQMQP